MQCLEIDMILWIEHADGRYRAIKSLIKKHNSYENGRNYKKGRAKYD